MWERFILIAAAVLIVVALIVGLLHLPWMILTVVAVAVILWGLALLLGGGRARGGPGV